MSDPEQSQEKVLHDQIVQLREIIASYRNSEARSIAINPDEILQLLMQNLNENESIHPRLLSLNHGSADVEEMEKAVKRLENDLEDLKNIQNSKSLYDPFKHDIEQSTADPKDKYNVNDNDTSEKAQNKRDKEQRPLSAYEEPK